MDPNERDARVFFERLALHPFMAVVVGEDDVWLYVKGITHDDLRSMVHEIAESFEER